MEALGNAICALITVMAVIWIFRRVGAWISWKIERAQWVDFGVKGVVEPVLSPVRLEDGHQLLVWFRTKGCCPDCGSLDFHRGPSEGFGMNILCSNCHAEFKAVPPFTTDRLPKPDAERLRTIYGLEPLLKLAEED